MLRGAELLRVSKHRSFGCCESIGRSVACTKRFGQTFDVRFSRVATPPPSDSSEQMVEAIHVHNIPPDRSETRLLVAKLLTFGPGGLRGVYHYFPAGYG